ncbi:CheY-like receiver, AAA-type ATPase, and DNA-binding domain containing response regulator [Desulfocurvibacter africanus PCS]|uniref:CheY-like receiver, AAA-type ATPase, and DNA-binding domain containing response regulator n=1 Tax=Desulfocurvibacter africanus PCS TaxID=1262666 RepID=M5Q2M7_DESAF|nr:sigma-54-dependent Fis family transcriptional regulator [Desulfocurvibacter africanus]EMG38601.1 CheY-like receiver, AAA-type ATPase, and DNA-binding domain containing response regulator [Desulfocurvibacter africanus PCS]
MKPKVLIVDDDQGHLAMLATMIKGWGYEAEKAGDGQEAVARVREKAFDALLMDVRMARLGGIEALREIKEYNPAIPVLIMTAYSSVESAKEALKAGAYDYLTKPLDFDELRITLERALDHTRLREENRALRQRMDTSSIQPNIIGRSRPMKELLDMLAMVAPTEATVLVTGESGTGKELIAKAVHAGSPRKNGPLVVVNCAALAESLLESELFGHEKGAFTGADRRREGRFQQAHKGTIFLDEIGEISQAMQAKLLRAIQEREVQRVGSDKPVSVDVRIIAATNRDLRKEVDEGRFREDLFYRLNVVTLRVPSLRERKDDVPLLAQHFLERFAKKNRKTLKGFTPQAMDALLRHDWPGNVRELENAVERAVILSLVEYVSERELPLLVAGEGSTEAQPQFALGGDRSLEDVEREAILATIDKTGGNKSETARILGVTRATLHKKLKQYGRE